MAKKVRNNPNGNLTVEELIKMVHSDNIDNYMRKHSLATDKCPPVSLISSDQQCSYCVKCFKYCLGRIKEYKNYYKIGQKQYNKEDFNG